MNQINPFRSGLAIVAVTPSIASTASDATTAKPRAASPARCCG
jgi:hypothetical protein